MCVGGEICCSPLPPLFEVVINGVVDHEVKSSTSVTHGTLRPLCDGRWKRRGVNNIDVVMY